jgi:lambda family phage portal protein
MADSPQRPFYEPFIERHFPGWHASRERARADAARYELVASYRGGVSTRTTSGWTTSTSYRAGTSADRTALKNMRDRARSVYRNNAIARTLLETEVNNIIASGITLQAQTNSQDFNAEVEERWAQWMEVADLRGLQGAGQLQRMFYRSSRKDGDAGIILVDKGGQSRLQFIPGDLIQDPMDKNGTVGTVVGGVEVNSYSQPIAFHILDAEEMGKRKTQRIAARNFIYLTPTMDDLGVRGETCYSTIFDYLDQLSGYVDAVVIAARMGAIFGLILKDENPTKQYQGLGTLTNSNGVQQKALTLENGLIRFVGGDNAVTQVVPQQPMNQTPDFIRAMLRLIGMPFDMPLELVAKDMSQVNFASARIGLLGYYRACRARQRWFVARAMDRIYQWWLSREVAAQRFVSAVPEQYWPHKFQPEAWDYTDPVSEAQADLLQMSMGTKDAQEIAAERGRDLEQIQLNMAAFMAMRRASKLPNVLSTLTRDEPEIVQPQAPSNTQNEGNNDTQNQA